MTALYNEIDPFAAAWLRELIKANLIAPGEVAECSIEDLTPNELRRFTQVHLFAGIGVWSYALRLAGWPDDRPVWTGSCPCQPFSAAGKGGGFADERHLWPAFHYLIEQCRPAVVFGEQVASKDGLDWLDLVQADMEGADYALGALDTCSAGHGAPHIRQRLRFAAYDLRSAAGGLQHAPSDGRQQRWSEPGERGAERGRGLVGLDHHHHHQGLEGLRDGHCSEAGQRQGSLRPVAETGGLERVADDINDGQRQLGNGVGGTPGAGEGESGQWQRLRADIANGLAVGRMADGDSGQRSGQPVVRGPEFDGQDAGRSQGGGVAQSCGADGGVADPHHHRRSKDVQRERADGVRGEGVIRGPRGRPVCGGADDRPGPTNGFWRDADWLFCRDGKWRPVESGTSPLVDGSASRMVRDGDLGAPINAHATSEARVGRLRGYGNAVDAHATADFIRAYLERVRLGAFE